MTNASDTFLLPDRIEPELDRVKAYWSDLKRGENAIPFWDDLKFSTLTQLCPDAAVIEVFEDPLRFRFDLSGEELTQRYGAPLAGKFTDELDLHAPVDQITDQCRAAVKGGAPNFFQRTGTGGAGYSRLILPLWGNGRIQMLVGAISYS